MTKQELREASDFADVLNDYCVGEEMFSSFVREDLKLGYRLFLAMNLPIDLLGILILKEDDERITRILKKRIEEINKTDRKYPNIVLG